MTRPSDAASLREAAQAFIDLHDADEHSDETWPCNGWCRQARALRAALAQPVPVASGDGIDRRETFVYQEGWEAGLMAALEGAALAAPVASADGAWEALLRQGLEACFASAGGNAQGPRSIMDFLRIAYLPAIEAAIRGSAGLDGNVLGEAIFRVGISQWKDERSQPLAWATENQQAWAHWLGQAQDAIAAEYARLARSSDSETP